MQCTKTPVNLTRKCAWGSLRRDSSCLFRGNEGPQPVEIRHVARDSVGVVDRQFDGEARVISRMSLGFTQLVRS